MRITVVGGGNIGTQFAVHSAEKGHSVTIYTSCPDYFAEHLTIIDKENKVIHEGNIVLATSDPHEAFHDADMIMITMPPTMMIPLAQMIYENTDAHTIIGFVPGNGGFEFVFKDCIERGNVLFGIDRVPGIARLTERGKTVCCSGYKEKLYVAALPSCKTDECAAVIESIYDIPCVRLPGFMALTLTPSNPILHTARLMTIFRDYKPGVTYDHLPLFYEEWDDASSELLLACDDEIQEICRALPEFGLEYVVSEREFYNANTAEEMTHAICTEESLLGLATPSAFYAKGMVEVKGLSGIKMRRKQRRQRIERYVRKRKNMSRAERRTYIADRIRKERQSKAKSAGLIPDLHSRYFTADFPYGLTVIQQIGSIAGVSMPNIDRLLEWYDNIAILNDKLYLSNYGITDMNDLRAFYLR